jgi:hypothetical protein
MAEVTPKIVGLQELDLIQGEIEIYTKKIEHEKINLRLTTERYENTLSHLLQLKGMPNPFKSKEEKEKDKKRKQELKKKKKPLYEKRPKLAKSEIIKQNPSLLSKEINKDELTLDKVKLI